MKRHKMGVTSVVLAAVLAGCAPALVGQSPTSRCMPADSNSDHVIAVLQNAMADSALRQALKLPLIQASQVALVTSNTRCRRAARVVDQRSGVADSKRRVYLFKVGTYYVIIDEKLWLAPGEKGLGFFTSAWLYQSAMRF